MLWLLGWLLIIIAIIGGFGGLFDADKRVQALQGAGGALVLGIVLVSIGSGEKAKPEPVYVAELDYLGNIPEVATWRVERNTVYIGFKSRPSDIGGIAAGAAISAANATKGPFHVFAMPVPQLENVGTSNWIFWCSATARQRRVLDSGGNTVERAMVTDRSC